MLEIKQGVLNLPTYITTVFPFTTYIFRFQNVNGIWLAQQLLASQGGLCSRDLDFYAILSAGTHHRMYCGWLCQN